jgi:hypothetical protein
VFSDLGRCSWNSGSVKILKLVSENFGQRDERCDGVIPDVREWYLRMRVFNASDMSFAAMISLSVEDNCGI